MIYKTVLTASVIGAASAIPVSSSDNAWQTDFVRADAATDVDLCGGRGNLVGVVGKGTSNLVNIVYPHRNRVDDETKYVGAIAMEPAAGAFGGEVDCTGDDITGNNLFVSTTGTGAGAAGTAGVHLFQGSWGEWTQTQFLAHASDGFAAHIAADDKTSRTLFVACPSCADSAETDGAGQVVVYQATSPSAKTWTRTQVLELDPTDFPAPADPSTEPVWAGLGTNTLVTHDGVMITDVSYDADGTTVDDPVWKLAVFVRHPNGQYSYQQMLNTDVLDANKDRLPTGVAVYDDVIAIGDSAVAVGADTNVGQVTVLDAYRGMKGKPLPVKWSAQQVLTTGADTRAADDYLGLSVFMGENQIVASESSDPAAGTLEVFSKVKSAWSFAQALEASDGTIDMASAVATPLIGEIYGGSMFLTDATNIGMFNMTGQSIRCLDISVIDKFGDGWDGAVLRVTGPDGTYDDFAPNCAAIGADDTETGTTAVPFTDFKTHLEFEYCPSSTSAGGLYKFQVIDGPKAKQNWEIEWAVRNQMEDNMVVFGGIATEVDFDYNVKSRSFHHLGIRRELKNETKCVPCPNHPPKHIVDLDMNDDVRWLDWSVELHADDDEVSDKEWYHSYGRPRFNVHDKAGHRRMVTGQFCHDSHEKPASGKCWMDIPDGEYYVRVADGAYYGEAPQTHKVKVCGVEVGSQEQFLFNISKGVCDTADAAVSVATLCFRMDVVVHGLGVMVLDGVSVSSLSELSVRDMAALEAAVAGSISGVAAVDAKIVGVSSGNHFTYKVAYKSSSFDASPQGGENQEAFTLLGKTLSTALVSKSAAGNIYSVLKSNVLDSLKSTSGITVSSFSLVGEGPVNTQHVTATNVDIGAKLTYVNSDSYATTFSKSVVSVQQLGYVVAGLSAVGIALFVVTRVAPVTKKQQRVEVAAV